MSQNQNNLDTLFALEFGQVLENYLFSCSNREEVKKVICSCFELKSENQLAQIFTGFDIPTTAAIFELIRTLNDDVFTQRFFSMRTTAVEPKSEPVQVKTTEATPQPVVVPIVDDYIARADEAFRNRHIRVNEDDDDDELGEIDFNLI